MAGDQSVRVVITGVGVISPAGVGNQAFWDSLKSGQTGIGYLNSLPADNLPSKLAAEVPAFDPRPFLRDRKFLKVMSREVLLGVCASTMAMRDAGLKRGAVDPERLGVDFGSGRISTSPEEVAEAVTRCSTAGSEFQFTRWGEDSMGEITPLWMLRQLPNMPACHVSIDHDARGPNNTITSRDASAILALCEAVRIIERRAADCMIVGACGSNIHPVDITKLHLFEGLSRRVDEPERACRPFDFDRDGTILGEGAAAFIVEEYGHAKRRQAEIYAEVVGIGAGCDGKGYANGAQGMGLARAIEAALRRSHLQPSQIGHINAHGKSTQRDDLVEARAYRRSFGEELAAKIPLTALKSYVGHSDSGSGAMEMAGTLLALRHGVLPPTLNYETPDPRCRLNVVHGEPLRLRNLTGITVNRTMMGQSAAAILRAI